MGNCESSSTEKQVHPLKLNDIEQGLGGVANPPIGQNLQGQIVHEITMPTKRPMTAKSHDVDPSKALQISKQIDEQLVRDYRSLEKVIKLLLLGPAESGKSTVLKQIRIIHLDGFSVADLRDRRPLVFKNVYEALVQIINGLRTLQIFLPATIEADINEFLAFFASYEFKNVMDFPQKMYPVIKRIWAEEKVRDVYNHRSDVYVMDCAKYFLDNLDRVCDPNYTPTTNDILQSRQETIGVSEIRYTYKDLEFRIFDVGGQKTERRKWIHVFDMCSAVFFIAAISEYDQFMREDNSTNRLIDALHLFKWIGNNDLFRKVQMILFLNKKDVFAEKIGKIPLTVCFPNYRYKNDYKNATIYIQKKFEQQIQNKTKMVYIHLTCATDTGQVQFLLNSVTDMIIAENFKQTGVI
uniref:G protein alpha subunit n=1 Tax=Panagrolaimus sp. JU765 TaxID=591449 RepID=A0AC34QCC2_9BILA